MLAIGAKAGPGEGAVKMTQQSGKRAPEDAEKENRHPLSFPPGQGWAPDQSISMQPEADRKHRTGHEVD